MSWFSTHGIVCHACANPAGHSAIAEADRLRYDAGQISVFDLLADSRAQIAGVSDYLQSVRDFWIARASLDAALSGPVPEL